MSRTANTKKLVFPASCCSTGESISLFYLGYKILVFWHCSTSITSQLNLLFFVLEAPEVIHQRGTFLTLFMKWAFKMIFNTFCCSLFPLFFQVSDFFQQLSCIKPKVQSWQKAYLMTERAEGEIDLYKRGLLWSECFQFFLPCLWIWDKWMISSFMNEDPWLSIKKNNWCGGGGSKNQMYSLKS